MMNSAASIDGKLAPAPDLRTSHFRPSRHAVDPTRMRELRSLADAVVIGASNLRFDDPDLALLPDERTRRKSSERSDPLRVVLTRTGQGIEAAQRMFDRALGGEPIVAHAREMNAATRARISEFATLVELGERDVDVALLLAWLARERGVRTVLTEGGGAVNAAFFAARAVDEVYVTVTPRILGGASAPTMVSGKGFTDDEIPDAKLAAVEQVGDELFLRYVLHWPEAIAGEGAR